MEPREKSIVLFSSGAHFFTHFYMLLFPALLMPISRDFGLPIAAVVNISFAMYLLYGVLAMGWGFVSDHWGHKPAMAAGQMLAGAGMALAGLVSGSTLAPITLCFALVGVGCSAYHPAGLALISQGVRRRGRAMGINGVWGNVGIAVVPLTAGVLNYLIGWRRGLLVLGLLGFLLGLASLFAPFSVTRGEERTSPQPRDREATGKLLLAFAAVTALAGLMTQCYTLVLPAFMEERLGSAAEAVHRLLPGLVRSPALQTLTAGLFTTAIYVLGIFGQAVGGRVADRHSLRKSYILFFLIAFPFALGLAALPGVWLILSAGVFVFFTLGMQPIENILVAALTPARWRSFSYGVKFTLTFGVGAFGVRLVSWAERGFGLSRAAAKSSSPGGLDGAIWLSAGLLALLLLFGGLFLLAGRESKAGPGVRSVEGA